MGWVKEHLDDEKRLAAGIPKLWRDLRESLKLAGGEFRTHSNRFNVKIQVEETGPNGIYILVTEDSAEQTMEVSLDMKARAISVVPSYPRPRSRLGFCLAADGEVTLAMDGKPVTVEQACRLLLEPMLFKA